MLSGKNVSLLGMWEEASCCSVRGVMNMGSAMSVFGQNDINMGSY